MSVPQSECQLEHGTYLQYSASMSNVSIDQVSHRDASICGKSTTFRDFHLCDSLPLVGCNEPARSNFAAARMHVDLRSAVKKFILHGDTVPYIHNETFFTY